MTFLIVLVCECLLQPCLGSRYKLREQISKQEGLGSYVNKMGASKGTVQASHVRHQIRQRSQSHGSSSTGGMRASGVGESKGTDVEQSVSALNASEQVVLEFGMDMEEENFRAKDTVSRLQQ